ncbi:acyltransferase family protein [Raineyella antarctica]|uniref:acyltransferase family protein n=1 Tax=Raineyella antarctica TaxID=1577474 RepID=UPI0015880AAE|nr:acyltransferase [Raineyella antarctica]
MNTPGTPTRNVAIDFARALSLLVVIGFHLMLFRVDVTTVGNGAPIRTFVGSPGPVGWTLGWFIMVMPLFFVAGGFANTLVIDRLQGQGATYGTWLVTRARRLLGPLAFYIAVWATVGTVIAWFGTFSTAMLGTQKLTGALWFLLVYLVVVILAPVMCAAHDRWGVLVLIVLAVLAIIVDAVRFSLGIGWAADINYVVVWLFVHQLGIAYHRGWWRTGPRIIIWATFAGAVIALLVLLKVVGYYPPSPAAVGDQAVGNLAPPTATMAALALAQTAVLAQVERAFGAALERARVLQKVLAWVNALAVTIYLWHGPIIALAIGLLYPLAERHPGRATVLLGRPLIIALALPLMVGLVPVISMVERRLVPPLGDAPRTRLAVASMVLLLVGFWLIYRTGMVLHPAAPRATIGLLCFAAGALMFRDASRQSRRHQHHHRGGGQTDESEVPGGRA